MPTINRDGVSIYYERHGSRDDVPTILLSHGYSATSAMWAGLLAELFMQASGVSNWT